MSTRELVERIDHHLRTLTEEIRNLEAARAALSEANKARRSTPAPAARRRGEAAPPEQLHSLLAEGGGMTTAALAKLAGADPAQVLRVLRDLESRGEVRRTGERRGTRWHAVTDEDRIRARAAELEARMNSAANRNAA